VSGDALGTAMDALFLAGGGLGFARLGWMGVRRRAPVPAGGGRDAGPPPSSTPWKLLWALCLAFGAFVAICGLFLALSLVLPGAGR
jgi:hypothetical protein